MKIHNLVIKEIFHRKLNYTISVIAAIIAAASLIGSVILFRIYDSKTNAILEKKQAELQERMDKLQDDTRKSMLKLGFNIAILPKGQNLADWHTDDYSTEYMPESYVDVLASSKIMTIQHLLPILQQKVLWPEKKRRIILVGTRGEVPFLNKSPKKPMAQPVDEGTIILGYELHQSMNIRANDRIRLMGKPFTVKDVYKERGNKDDISAWIHLKDAQNLFGKRGQINAIMALECVCNGGALPIVRKEITELLPGTQVIERGSQALARAEARMQVEKEAAVSIEKEKQGREQLRAEREIIVSILLPIILTACGLWIFAMGFINVRSRRSEVGILQTLGISTGRIFMLFIWKHFSIGVIGGLFGLLFGILLPLLFSGSDNIVKLNGIITIQSWFGLLILSAIGTSFLSVLAGWIPAMSASRQDPAEVLREE